VSRSGVQLALRIQWTLTRLIWIAAMIAAPLFGVWLASSLAAYNNASQWLALGVGLLLLRSTTRARPR
jgi:hypothetical protein